MPLDLSRLPRPDLIPPAVVGLLRQVAAYEEVAFIGIFGSRALGDAAETSDVDVTVSAPSISNERWLQLRLLAEEAPTLLWITLIRFEESPRDLQARNLADGVIIYESEKTERQSAEFAKGID